MEAYKYGLWMFLVSHSSCFEITHQTMKTLCTQWMFQVDIATGWCFQLSSTHFIRDGSSLQCHQCEQAINVNTTIPPSLWAWPKTRAPNKSLETDKFAGIPMELSMHLLRHTRVVLLRIVCRYFKRKNDEMFATPRLWWTLP